MDVLTYESYSEARSHFKDLLDAAARGLREYAADWQDHLLDSPNHRNNWGLVQLIALSDDQELKNWLTGTER